MMILTKVAIILLFCTLGVLPRSLRREPGMHFEELDIPEEEEKPSAKKSLDRIKEILFEQELPNDSQIYEALHEPPKRFKLVRTHCPNGQMMDHRGRCRQIW
ncbi:uncharacterized protein LOC129800862 [Phlebotomus papatasi]|uniref:uncharacterized protein LOC129800862 n=1 Tax=Phlebotomus papatasi TaxID=29031 RepID=UPI0024846D80|nr:uncharacterized protein LOC129800862 [Phlebotomus papatasi]